MKDRSKRRAETARGKVLNGGRQREGKTRICSCWKEAANTAFEASVMHSVLFIAVTDTACRFSTFSFAKLGGTSHKD